MKNTQASQEMEIHMKRALTLAKQAYEAGEVPCGAVVVVEGVIVGEAHNMVEQNQDATAHAECLALQAACKQMGSKYLKGATLYTTLEPCPMCAMASFWTQIDRLVFGASDVKRGYQQISPRLVHPRTQIIGGLYAKESNHLLRSFFQALRRDNNTTSS